MGAQSNSINLWLSVRKRFSLTIALCITTFSLPHYSNTSESSKDIKVVILQVYVVHMATDFREVSMVFVVLTYFCVIALECNDGCHREVATVIFEMAFLLETGFHKGHHISGRSEIDSLHFVNNSAKTAVNIPSFYSSL